MQGKFDSIISGPRPVLIDFHALWCEPCKLQSPILKEVAAEFGERVRVLKIDVDQNNEIAQRYNVQSVPTLMIFKNNKLVWRQSGVVSKNQLISVLFQNI